MNAEPIRAFPHKREVRQQVTAELECVTPGDDPGMTLRDYFAAKAMAALILHPNSDPNTWALAAYEMADKMLAARGGEATEESEK